jgi:mono/diheme cytochrome c family protein
LVPKETLNLFDPESVFGQRSFTKPSRMKKHLLASLITAAVAASLATVRAADVDVSKLPKPSDKQGVTYESDIKPIFEKSCFKCHGAEKQKGKLRLDSLAAALKGGENGPNIIPKDSAKSQLVQAVARILEEDENMPPEGKGDPLKKDQVALIRAWIDQGAK